MRPRCYNVVVLPRSSEQVQAILRLSHREGIPLVPRGAGTGLAGGALALQILTRVSARLDESICARRDTLHHAVRGAVQPLQGRLQ